MQRVRGEAGAEASLSLAGRLVPELDTDSERPVGSWRI
jgi:hypothetical protein